LRPPTKQTVERHTVGREKERAELRAGFKSALNGRGQLLCVAGEPDIGKTTLVEDFLAELAVKGQCTIARGRLRRPGTPKSRRSPAEVGSP
jgi:predicted ATPase